MPSELDIFLSLPRHARRKVSRDQSRMLPIPPLPPRGGEVAERVNAPHRMRTQPSRRSGQQRINAKRNARAAYWRTVKVHVHPDIEQSFREHVHLLGEGARIDGRRLPVHMFAIELDVHIPGAPAAAVKAEPVFGGNRIGERYEPFLLGIDWYDADGERLTVEAEQMAEATP